MKTKITQILLVAVAMILIAITKKETIVEVEVVKEVPVEVEVIKEIEVIKEVVKEIEVPVTEIVIKEVKTSTETPTAVQPIENNVDTLSTNMVEPIRETRGKPCEIEFEQEEIPREFPVEFSVEFPVELPEDDIPESYCEIVDPERG